VRLPVAITARVDEARRLLLQTVEELPDPPIEEPSVSVVDVGEKTTWLAVTGYAPRRTAVDRTAAELRERALEALAAEGFLPQ
jgi:hypothetical protein